MSDLAMVLGLLGAAVVMFAINRPRMDVVAVMMMVALPLTGVISMSEALLGFADPNIVLIAALFVIGEALVRTGVTQRVGDWLSGQAGASEGRLTAFLMLTVGAVGSFISSTGVVAIFIPIVLRIARKAAIPAGRLMMPLSMAALISGLMTLVATAPNLIVNAELTRQGHGGFGLFAVTPFGIAFLLLAVLYMMVARRFLAPGPVPELPARAALTGWVEDYDLAGREYRLRLRPGSALVGSRLDQLDLRASAGINIIAIDRGNRFRRKLINPRADTVLEGGDTLLIDYNPPADGNGFDIEGFIKQHNLIKLALSGQWFADKSQEIGMAQIMVPPNSTLIGKTVIKAQFRTRYRLSVIGMKHGAKAVPSNVIHEPLRSGDTLLAVGPWHAIRALANERRDLVLLDLPSEFHEAVPAPHQAPLAVGVLALVIAMMAFSIVPNVQAALIGCLLLGLFRCVDMTAAYRSIHWQSLVLIVGMLPFSLALERTGGVDMAAEAILDALDGTPPRMVLAVIFTTTALLSLFISNTATAVLMAPVALKIAAALGASPYPFAMTVALAASAAFMTPVSSPVNTLVVGPGNYRFGDFVRIGTPFAIICLVTSVVLVPLILPF
ncbi:MAG: SLC13 family permease [Erythrobacter sp.]